MQAWVQATGARIVVIFEGRDAAGKGSTIKRVAEYLNPRVTRIVALPTPSERDKTRWYFQRYVPHLPAAGEIVLMDRSWYNRAGVEHVMGYCTNDGVPPVPAPGADLRADAGRRRHHPAQVLVQRVGHRAGEALPRSRDDDPMRRWKLSPNDVLSITKWEDYSRAKDTMFVHTDIPEAPWFEVDNEDKRRGRINMIAHLLSQIPYETRRARGDRDSRSVRRRAATSARRARPRRARLRRGGREAHAAERVDSTKSKRGARRPPRKIAEREQAADAG